MVVIAVLALLLALVAAVVAGLALRDLRALKSGGEDLPPDVRALRQEVAALRAEAAGALRHLAVVRYDAFSDQGGHLSWSLALTDDAGDGVLVSSIHGRTEARTYAKTLAGWACEQQLSPEETEVVAATRG